MREVLVISGKGGTGKTTLVAALTCFKNDIVVADCDVDAPDLHLLLKPEVEREFEFKGEEIAYIDKKLCKQCGVCISVCQFDAISDDYVVDEFSCEGCGVCEWMCPAKSIVMKERIQGKYFISSIKAGKMVHAQLFPGAENSGKLVTKVKNLAREVATEEKAEGILIDGAPGIGCPVIASLSRVNLALIVTEPTVSGVHDLKRIVELAEFFKIKVKVIINKFDLNILKTEEIEDYCRSKRISVVSKIPFYYEMIEALNRGLSIVEYSSNPEILNPYEDISREIWEGE